MRHTERTTHDATTASADTLRALLGINRCGPRPGEGANGRPPSWGIVEETPQIWSSWLAAWWKRLTRQPLPAVPPFVLRYGTDTVRLESVRQTFGYRWYFRCPRCGRRCEVLYVGRRGLACRFCNRLIYRSQARRITPLIDLFEWTRNRDRTTAVPVALAPLFEALAEQFRSEMTDLFRDLQLVRTTPKEVPHAEEA